MFSGAPGTGKSTVAERIGAALGVPVFSGDWMAGCLTPFGRRAFEQLVPMVTEQVVTLVLRQLSLGQPAIVDLPVDDVAQGHVEDSRFVPQTWVPRYCGAWPRWWLNLAGFPWHPHRGIETITYVLAGTVEKSEQVDFPGHAMNPQALTSRSGTSCCEIALLAERFFGTT